MRYAYDFTVPADTKVSNPVSLSVRLATGRLVQVLVRFKAGCHNRVYLAVYDDLLQIVPAFETQALNGDNVIYEIPMSYPLPEQPYTLTVKGWSDNSRYDHLITLWFDVIETAVDKQQGVLGQLKHLLGSGQ